MFGRLWRLRPPTWKTAPARQPQQLKQWGRFESGLDQGVPRDAAGLLRQLGYECIHTGEAGMSMASDEEILAWAREQGALIITLDADFHTMLAVSGANGPSVVRIRMEGLGAQAASVGKVREIGSGK